MGLNLGAKKENEKSKTRVRMLQCLIWEARQESDEDDSDKDTDDDEYCDKCAAKITPSDDNTFHCMNNICDKVVCGRRGCSQSLAYYVAAKNVCEHSGEDNACSDEDERQNERLTLNSSEFTRGSRAKGYSTMPSSDNECAVVTCCNGHKVCEKHYLQRAKAVYEEGRLAFVDNDVTCAQRCFLCRTDLDDDGFSDKY